MVIELSQEDRRRRSWDMVERDKAERDGAVHTATERPSLA